MLEQVDRTGAYSDLALHAAFDRSHLSTRERAFATQLVCGTLRWRGRLDFGLAFALERGLAALEPRVVNLLRLGAYQILLLDQVPDAVAVSETVQLTRAVGLERAAGLVNAVLRRVAREREALPLPLLADDPLGHLVHALSIPAWIAERWIASYGADAAAALALASNAPAPLTARANRRLVRRDELLDELRERFPDAEACRFAPDGIRLGGRRQSRPPRSEAESAEPNEGHQLGGRRGSRPASGARSKAKPSGGHQVASDAESAEPNEGRQLGGGDPARDPAFLDGRFTIQDEASQLVVEWLDPRPGERVLDGCAAPGAKATAIAERVGDAGLVVGLDRHARRLEMLARDARRLGLANVRTFHADAARPLDAVAGPASFDRILVDAPCSGLGALRRNPDARWRLRPSAPARLAALQRSILRHVRPLLVPGGVLVYSTCTLAVEENEAVIEAFLAEAPEFRRAGVPASIAPLVGADGFLRTFPHRIDADGFFAARLERTR